MQSDNLPDHSILAASACERWWNCPGAVEAAQEHPSKSTVYTAEGSVAHDLAATTLMKEWDYDKLSTLIGMERAHDEFIIEVTEEMVDAIWIYVEHIRSFLRPGAVMHIEKKIIIPEIHPLLFATPDCVIIWPYERVMVFDFKYGKGKKVSAWENKQLLYYLMRYYIDEDIEEAEITIVQPRIGDEPVSNFVCSLDALREFKNELAVRAKEAMKPKAPRVAGDWCQQSFCPAFQTCSTANDKAYEIVAKDFEEIQDPDTALKSLTMEQIVKVLQNQNFITAWLKKINEYAKELAYQGENIPGYKLVMSYGNRAWLSEDALVADFEHKHGSKMYEPAKLKSPAQMEKVIGKKAVDEYCHKPQNGYKLVLETAKGEPIRLTKAEDDFEEV